MMTDDSDEDLIQRCRDGDGGAFQILVSRYQRPIYGAAYRVLGSAEDARDVTQIAFMEVASRLDGYDPRHKFFSWIYRIALNAALNLLRRRRREERLPAADLARPGPADPESQARESEAWRNVERALMRLGDDHRAVLALRHESGLSYRQIALVLEIDEKRVKSRLFEARQRLREILSGLEGE
jgi:RNA polymerase sigma-70 factor (ECF subfamily)